MDREQSENLFQEHLEAARHLLGSPGGAADLIEANEHISQALFLRPRTPEAWILKSQILSSLEDDFAALAAIEMAIRTAPRLSQHHAEAHYVRAAVLADMDRFSDALRSIERAFRFLGPDGDWLLEDLYFEKASILDAIGRQDDAATVLERGLSSCPESQLLRTGLEPLRRERVRRNLKVLQGGRR